VALTVASWVAAAPHVASAQATVDPATPAAATADRGDPAAHLPPDTLQLTAFGERADWSHDGKRILFLSKTFGDAMEIDVATRQIRNLSAHFPHYGFTRALYLSDGNFLLAGPTEFDPRRAADARDQCWLFVLDKDLKRPAIPLGVKCSEGPAVSRKRMHIAYAQLAQQYPEEMKPGQSRILQADVVRDDDGWKLANEQLVLASQDLPFECRLEAQNFRPPAENELTFSAYEYQGTDACGINLKTKKVTNYSNAPNQYDEPEGIFPDGKATLVESDKQNGQGSTHVDLWTLALDASGKMTRWTFFSDFPGYKASNGVVSDDGGFMAFQLAKSGEAAGVGHGIFIKEIVHPWP
jgi:hypothetical protein